MSNIKFESLEQCIEYYGRGALVAIDCLPQIIFYIKNGYQPCFVFENQKKKGKLTCWFLKNETGEIYRKWMDNKPEKGQKNG